MKEGNICRARVAKEGKEKLTIFRFEHVEQMRRENKANFSVTEG